MFSCVLCQKEVKELVLIYQGKGLKHIGVCEECADKMEGN